ncbi:MAG: hypothetical protein LBJ16_02660 [Holosporaceae bacterium]|nr:hypothetical protein [Holosporaceae bacterium]
MVHVVHEDPSTEATRKLPKERMFRKKSIFVHGRSSSDMEIFSLFSYSFIFIFFNIFHGVALADPIKNIVKTTRLQCILC